MLAGVLRSLESYAVLYLVYTNILLVIDGYTLRKCFNSVLEACLQEHCQYIFFLVEQHKALGNPQQPEVPGFCPWAFNNLSSGL